MVKRFDIATNSGGAYVGTMVISEPSLLYAAQWVDGTLVDGVGATLTEAQLSPGDAANTILTLTAANNDAMYYPRALEHSSVGAALTTYTPMLLHGTLTLTVAAGGDTKSGALWLYLVPLGE